MLLLQVPPLQSLKVSNPFHSVHGSKPSSSFTPSAPSFLPPIRAMKSMQGKVVCSTNDKTVAVEVVRLAPHPKYKRRIKKKKKYQAHDPDNQFKVGDIVLLQKTRPISKTKTFLAVPSPSRAPKNNSPQDSSGDFPVPLQ